MPAVIKPSSWPVFLYIPNLIGTGLSSINPRDYLTFYIFGRWQLNLSIGYLRVVMAIASFYYIRQPSYFLPLYVASCLLDALDGHAARYLGQCSKFGAVLDMVTDRSTTAGLLVYLANMYPNWMLLFQLLICLDLSSHYMHMYSSLSTGSASHKKIAKSGNFVLRIYYTSQAALFIACALNEAFFISIYALGRGVRFMIPINVAGQQYEFWTIMAAISVPVCALKQVINVVQLVKASQQLAKPDQPPSVSKMTPSKQSMGARPAKTTGTPRSPRVSSRPRTPAKANAL